MSEEEDLTLLVASAVLSAFGGPMLASANTDRAMALIAALDHRGLSIVPSKSIEIQKDISGLLRAQIRMLGQIPCVVETEDIGRKEYEMRAKVRGN